MSEASPTSSTLLAKYRYPTLVGVYVLVTGFFTFRIARNPLYSRNLKFEQIETIFKATSLGAVVAGVTISDGWGRGRSREHREDCDRRRSDE